MNKEFTVYANEVVRRIGINGRKAREIREDIYTSLIEKQRNTGENDPYILMGDPEEVAEEFRENLDIKEQHIYYGMNNNLYGREYISRTKVFGVPLVHVNYKGLGVAKGIIAIGNIAVGVLAIGVLPIGVVSIGAFALGLLLAFGGAAFAGISAFGGIAISVGGSFGGLAIAKYFAVGGFAVGDIAIGGTAKGIISVYKQSGSGQYLYQSPVNVDEVMNSIKTVYPKMSETVLRIIKYIIESL